VKQPIHNPKRKIPFTNPTIHLPLSLNTLPAFLFSFKVTTQNHPSRQPITIHPPLHSLSPSHHPPLSILPLLLPLSILPLTPHHPYSPLPPSPFPLHSPPTILILILILNPQSQSQSQSQSHSPFSILIPKPKSPPNKNRIQPLRITNNQMRNPTQLLNLLVQRTGRYPDGGQHAACRAHEAI